MRSGDAVPIRGRPSHPGDTGARRKTWPDREWEIPAETSPGPRRPHSRSQTSGRSRLRPPLVQDKRDQMAHVHEVWIKSRNAARDLVDLVIVFWRIGMHQQWLHDAGQE